jgi:hypothetical protein
MLFIAYGLIICFLWFSCQPKDTPAYNLAFSYQVCSSGTTTTYCSGPGNNCRKVGDINQTTLGRDLFNKFYSSVQSNTTKNFFDSTDWSKIFPTDALTPDILAKIQSYQYAVKITSDSSILFVRDINGKIDDNNVIFVFSRNDINLDDSPCRD